MEYGAAGGGWRMIKLLALDYDWTMLDYSAHKPAFSQDLLDYLTRDVYKRQPIVLRALPLRGSTIVRTPSPYPYPTK